MQALLLLLLLPLLLLPVPLLRCSVLRCANIGSAACACACACAAGGGLMEPPAARWRWPVVCQCTVHTYCFLAVRRDAFSACFGPLLG